MNKKRCSTCGIEYPATTEFFYVQKRGLYGLKSKCKKCTAIYDQKRNSSPEKKSLDHERQRLYRANPATQERIKKYRSTSEYRERVRGYVGKYLSKPGMREIQRERSRQSDAKPEARERKRIRDHKKRTLKRSLPDTFTINDWHYALNYFHGCCAACGRPLNDLFGTHYTAMDHWIPIISPDCPGTVPWNIVPLCHGIGGCNNGKVDTPALIWLVGKFGKRKGRQIFNRIQAYLDSLK